MFLVYVKIQVQAREKSSIGKIVKQKIRWFSSPKNNDKFWCILALLDHINAIFIKHKPLFFEEWNIKRDKHNNVFFPAAVQIHFWTQFDQIGNLREGH